MKVILIQDCKDGKKNEIIDVSDGYATNFLIRKKMALPLNKSTINKVNIEKEKIIDQKNIENKKNIEFKNMIENVQLLFYLKETNNVIHGTITKKQIYKELLKKGIKLNSLMIDNVKIQSFGLSSVKIFLSKDIIANLKVKVEHEK